MLPEDPILLPEIIDHVFLVAVHPASGREYEEAQSVGDSLRLLGEQPLAPTLFRRFANLGRFVAPYAVEAQADPLDPTTKYFLNRWIDDYYSRRGATVETAWPRSLRFLTTTLANEAFRVEGENVAMLAAGAARDELQVERVTLRIQANPEPPHGAAADFDLVRLVNGAEVSRDRWTLSLQFTFLDTVDPELMIVNPMGLLITYLRGDRALVTG